ncbi:MAG: alpha/beta hydrolase [Oscillospiraceae bacterium]|nr:alpha/beta hydrolase [Oscillospiraceae bacterium]
MYEKNYDVLKQVCAEKAVIRPVSQHRKPDGSMDIEGNLRLWNEALARFEVLPLWEDGAPGYDDRDPLQPPPSLVFVPSPKADKKRGTVIVACGGGFETRTGCEGMNVAEYFTDAGFNTAILTYRLKPYSRWDALADMQRAIRLLRAKKEELNITDKVAAMGFSAGGMLSANAATHFDGGDPEAADPAERESCRPDAAVLGYGAFAFAGLPGGFFVDPFGDRVFNPYVANKEELIYFAPEVNVTRATPPFFIWQTNSDDPRHSFTLGQALTAVGIPFEMHLFPQGAHGLALADGNNDLGMNLPHVARWAALCAEWLEEQGI